MHAQRTSERYSRRSAPTQHQTRSAKPLPTPLRDRSAHSSGRPRSRLVPRPQREVRLRAATAETPLQGSSGRRNPVIGTGGLELKPAGHQLGGPSPFPVVPFPWTGPNVYKCHRVAGDTCGEHSRATGGVHAGDRNPASSPLDARERGAGQSRESAGQFPIKAECPRGNSGSSTQGRLHARAADCMAPNGLLLFGVLGRA